MAHESVITTFVVIAAVALALQAAVLVFIFLAIRKIGQEVEAVGLEVRQRIRPVADVLTQILGNARDPLAEITKNIAETSRIIAERTRALDRAVAEMADRARLQGVRLDETITSLVRRFERMVDTVERGVLSPVRELSALLKGLRTGLDFFLSRRPSSPVSEATQDEELFI